MCLCTHAAGRAVQVTVQTDGPPVTITRFPSTIVASSAVGFSFVSAASDSDITFQCLLQGSSISSTTFTACTSPTCAPAAALPCRGTVRCWRVACASAAARTSCSGGRANRHFRSVLDEGGTVMLPCTPQNAALRGRSAAGMAALPRLRQGVLRTPLCGCRVYRSLADGNYKFQVSAVAPSGDAGAVQEYDFTVDTTAPTVANVTFAGLCAPPC